MSLVTLIEKQCFVLNLENIDIADVMMNEEGKSKEEIKIKDTNYFEDLLAVENINLEYLDGEQAYMIFNQNHKTLLIDINDKAHRLSILDFLEYDKYKKVANYFLQKTRVTLKDPSEQIGGVINKNYGFKFKIILHEKEE